MAQSRDRAALSKVSRIVKEKDLAAIITCRQKKKILKILAKCQVSEQVQKS